jgi:hypothetical protein
MWDDRFLFVSAALIAIAYSALNRPSTKLDKAIRLGHYTINVRSALLAGGIAVLAGIIGSRLGLYWHTSRLPNVGSAIAILLGLVVGAFTAKFVSSLFKPQFGRRDPIIGAGVLALLIVVYSLPLYSEAISDIFNAIGLSAVKTPFLELNVRDRGTKNYISAAGTQSNVSGVPRLSNPLPGLKWLQLDTAAAVDPDNTFPADEGYIRIFEGDIFDDERHKNAVKRIEKFFIPARILSQCLNNYVSVIPDSALLIVDIKPAIESLFEQHANAKKSQADDLLSFWTRTEKVLENVTSRFSVADCGPGKIQELKTLKGDAVSTVLGLQPYSALVLADLIYAHGAEDEAIAILAEWLSLFQKNEKARMDEEEATPRWWELRVRSRIALWMADVAGQNNFAYRAFINNYRRDLEDYFGKVKDPMQRVSLDKLLTKCDGWREEFKQRKSAPDDPIEQKAYYLLLAAEDESLRTELNFIGEEGSFENLEDLYLRASFVTKVGQECLPWSFAPDLRNAMINDHKVTVGLVGLTIADRMQTLARSRGDRDRATEIARDAEKFLREGYAALSDRVNKDRDKIQASEEWSDRIFGQSDWEKSANLAERAVIRLRTKD